jgi:hypothetical protein
MVKEFLPTPNTMDHLPARSDEALARAKKNGGCSNLKDVLLPTPVASQNHKPIRPRTPSEEAGTHGKCLVGEFAEYTKNLPTPRTCSAMAATINPDAQFPNLETVIAQETGERGVLNPSFVEAMMMFPEGWTLPD